MVFLWLYVDLVNRWTVILRRIGGSTSFTVDWESFKNGFGDTSQDYWLGNEYLHYLTNIRAYKQRFDLEDWDGNTAYAEYSSFVVNSEADNYRLLLGDYSGNASNDQADDRRNGFLYHNNMQFSTKDRDNDRKSGGSCVNVRGFGGFWYNYCSRITPTNRRCGNADCSDWGERIRWIAWRGTWYSLKNIQMMFRPVWMVRGCRRRYTPWWFCQWHTVVFYWGFANDHIVGNQIWMTQWKGISCVWIDRLQRKSNR